MSAEHGEIWLFDPGDISGGGQRFGLRLAVELRRRGAAVHMACPASSPLGEWSRGSGIEVADLRLPLIAPARLASIGAAVRRTRRLLRSMPEGAVVVGNHPRAQAYLYASSRFLREPPAAVNLMHERETAHRLSARFVHRRFGSMVVIGSNAAEEYRSRLDGVTIVQANNFLPAELFDRAAIDRRPAGSGGKPVLGVLGRMIPEKGIAELVEELAAKEVLPLWSELRVGAPFQDEAYVREVQRLIGSHGLGDRVRLLGAVEDVPVFLDSIDILMVPSTGSEAQPTAILEALARGAPAVVRAPLWSSDFEGLPVTPYDDSRELAAALRDRPDGAASPEELERRFGPDQVVAALDAAAQAARARA